MTIGETLPLWEAELSRLAHPHIHVPLPSLLGILEGPGTVDADMACRDFAATGQWPQLSEPIRLEVVLRLCCLRW